MDFNYLALCHHIISKHIGIEFSESKTVATCGIYQKTTSKIYGKLVRI